MQMSHVTAALALAALAIAAPAFAQGDGEGGNGGLPPADDGNGGAWIKVSNRALLWGDSGDGGAQEAGEYYRFGRDPDGDTLLLRPRSGQVALAVDADGGVRADRLRSGTVEDVGATVVALQDKVACLTDVVAFQAGGGSVTDLPPPLCTCLHGAAANDHCSFIESCADASEAGEYWLVPSGDASASYRSMCGADGSEWPDDDVFSYASTVFLLQASTVPAGPAPTVPIYVRDSSDETMVATPSSGGATVEHGELGYPSAGVKLAAGATLLQQHDPSFDVDTADFTLDFWAKLHTSTGGNYLVMVGMQAYASLSYPSCVFSVSGFAVSTSSDGTVMVRMAHHTGADATEAAPLCSSEAGAAAPAGTWAHYAVQKIGGTAALYINGVRACGKDDVAAWDMTRHSLEQPIALGQGYAGNAPGTCNIRHTTSADAVSYEAVRLTLAPRFDVDGFEPPSRAPRAPADDASSASG